MTSTMTVSGHCETCTLQEHYVFHQTPWCPKMFALLHVDTNSGDPHEETGRYVRVGRPSRPVEVGELVLIFDTNDGEDQPFATWGRVVRGGERSADALEVGWTGKGGNGWLYSRDYEW